MGEEGLKIYGYPKRIAEQMVSGRTRGHLDDADEGWETSHVSVLIDLSLDG